MPVVLMFTIFFIVIIAIIVKAFMTMEDIQGDPDPNLRDTHFECKVSTSPSEICTYRFVDLSMRISARAIWKGRFQVGETLTPAAQKEYPKP